MILHCLIFTSRHIADNNMLGAVTNFWQFTENVKLQTTVVDFLSYLTYKECKDSSIKTMGLVALLEIDFYLTVKDIVLHSLALCKYASIVLWEVCVLSNFGASVLWWKYYKQCGTDSVWRCLFLQSQANCQQVTQSWSWPEALLWMWKGNLEQRPSVCLTPYREGDQEQCPTLR